MFIRCFFGGVMLSERHFWRFGFWFDFKFVVSLGVL